MAARLAARVRTRSPGTNASPTEAGCQWVVPAAEYSTLPAASIMELAVSGGTEEFVV